ncbi:MAG TPA: hypothetical protein PLL33_10275, partial [Paracoccus sp. (in: a-proteobacteria)]|nr:hypothetical protein [Paracoccus sp. (in: a-proteobacteria)]
MRPWHRCADLAVRLSDSEAELQDSGARLAEALAGLAPWRGDAPALTALPCPAPDTLSAWRARLDQATAVRDDAARSLRNRQAESRRRAAEAAALAADLGTADPTAAAAARAARDSAWATHRLRLDIASADAFAAAMDAHDAALAAQLGRAADIGQLHRARQDADVADRLAADASADLA